MKIRTIQERDEITMQLEEERIRYRGDKCILVGRSRAE